MVSKLKKISITVSIALIATIIAVAVFSYARTRSSADVAAHAQDDRIEWTPSIRVKAGQGDGIAAYTEINDAVNMSDEQQEIYYFVKFKKGSFNNNTFKYAKTTQKQSIDEIQTATVTWTTIVANDHRIDSEENGTEYTYIYASETVKGDFTGYVYFSRSYNQITGGASQTITEMYPSPKGLKYNYVTGTQKTEITSVTATTDGGVPYNGGWLKGGLDFTVTTALMGDSANQKAFNTEKEKLSYSIDGGEKFITMTGNTVTVTGKTLNGVKVIFRLTDRAKDEHTYTYELPVKMDPNKPEFTVIAETTDLNGNKADYENGAWTSNNVAFTLKDVGSCCSTVSYKISVGGEEYTSAADITTFSETAKDVKFKAVNEAGVEYEYKTVFAVNIDKSKPNVSVSATTPNPDDETQKKSLTSTKNSLGTISFGYANGSIEVYVYNRDSSGKAIENASGADFQYQKQNDGTYSGNWSAMTKQVVSDKGEKGYVLTAAAGEKMSVSHTYKFRIKSKAGLISDETEITFTVIKSTYLIEIGEVTAEMNSLGWIADKAVVRVSVPTDSTLGADGKYLTPTMTYDFYYKASNSSDVSRATGRAAEFHEAKESEVRWWYEFDLVASADSTFAIYAKNAAGKSSANTEVTENKIKIDVLDPTYTMSAYIYPRKEVPSEDIIWLDTENPGWVNGQISLTLKVREGVSGIYVKELIYATENGKILRDETTNEIIWQPRNALLTSSESVTEKDINGVEWNWVIYKININAEETDGSGFYNGSREYRYRVYTNSGKYVDAKFTANIDTTDTMAITVMEAKSGDKEKSVTVTGATGQRVIDLTATDCYFPVCENTEFTFTTNIDKEGVDKHYVLRYRYFNGSGMNESELIETAKLLSDVDYKDLAAGTPLGVTIPENAVGDYYLAIYAYSKAQSYDGSVVGAGPYVVKLHYDTKNLSIIYALSVEDDSTKTEAMQAGNWVKGKVSGTITVKTNDDEGVKLDSSYTCYYMLLSSKTSSTPDDKWVMITDGMFNDDGSYSFTIPFTDDGFNGYVAVSVCNAAGYRSEQEASSRNRIVIDNTTPDPDEAIICVQKTETGVTYADAVRADKSVMQVETSSIDVYSYYTTNTMNLFPPTQTSRSTVSVYYKYLGQDVKKIKYDQGDFTKLEGSAVDVFGAAKLTLSQTKYTAAYFALYVVNGVGTEAPSATLASSTGEITIKRVYRFVSDPSVMSGSVSFEAKDGTYSEQTGMFTYLWKDKIVIHITGQGSCAPSEETNYMTAQFSVDGGKSWFDYLDAGSVRVWQASGEEMQLVFSPDLLRQYVDQDGNKPFANGVNSAFRFRVRNKAGATKLCGSAHIAMEDTVPEFKIIMLDKDNAEYNGGEADLAKSPSKWTSGPVTVKIETTVMPASGITYMYYIEYNDGTNLISTAEDGTYGKRLINYASFSTDTLDGFNLNRDAILTITAIGNSSSSRLFQQKVRIAVDQVTPDFTLSGNAFNTESSQHELISSGQWTNKNRVSISKAKNAENVSEVVYYYTIKYKDGAAREEVPTEWSDSLGAIEVSRSCVFTVTATSASGLVCTKEFAVNIDTTAPIIRFDGGMNVIPGEEYFIDLKVYVDEANIEICEYITIKGNTRGYPFAPKGYILSTSSVDNSTRYDSNGVAYSGYVKVYVKDYAGNEASIEFYVLPFRLTVNNLTLTDEDLAQVDAYEAALAKARNYMEKNRVSYFENLISRLNDRENTLRKEIKGYQDYLEKLYSRSSFELRSDYQEMYSYMETFNNYKVYGQEWIQKAIIGDITSKYYAYYENFKTQFDKLDALMKEVENAQNQVIALPAINMVEREDWNDILTVYDNYRNLSMDQKACFKANLYNKLILLKEACEVLLLVDEDLGVGINGDFAPGATINVTQYTSSTETFSNAQTMLAKTVSSSEARTVVSIYRVALEGAYAQTSVSDITVTLPIADEYKDYIDFAVYELSDDGSMKEIKSERQKDGTTVQFKTEKLSTYVMCIKSELSETTSQDGVYGSILGLELDTKMIKYLVIIGGALFGIVLLVVIVLGIRHRRFLNSYNRAYRHSLYRKSVKGVPKGNKM